MYRMIAIAKDFFLLEYRKPDWPTSSNIYVIPGKDGLNIIDTGLNKEDCFSEVSSCIRELGFQPSDIQTILLTHGHTDHIAGVNIVKKYSDPRILLSDKCIPEAIDLARQEHACLPSSVRDISLEVRNYNILENFARTCGEWKLNREQLLPIKGGEELKLGRYTFQSIYAPGHDIGLMVFYEPDSKWLLTTDLLKSSGPGSALPWYSSSAGGPSNYLASLDEIGKLDVKQAFPSHGAFNESLTGAIRHTRETILGRKAKIIASLRSGSKTCDQIDRLLFKPVVLGLCPWFASVTESHLVELERDGAIKRDGLDYVLVK